MATLCLQLQMTLGCKYMPVCMCMNSVISGIRTISCTLHTQIFNERCFCNSNKKKNYAKKKKMWDGED